MIKDILDELNENTSTNFKLEVLKKHKDNELLKRVISMALNKVKYTYSISMKNIVYVEEAVYGRSGYSLDEALDFLELELCTRNITGNEAIKELTYTLENLSKDDAIVLERIINRDLKVNVGKTQVNKVWKNLITKPNYMRCNTYSAKTAKNISFPAYLQKKSDGRYVSIAVQNNEVTFTSRSGEEQEFPLLEQTFKNLKDGVYIGELLVKDIEDRSKANGLINSSNPPHNDIIVELWDFITLEEYSDGKHSDKSIQRIKYKQRYQTLIDNATDLDNNLITIIDTFEVNNIKEALEVTGDLMNQGFEGGVLKDFNNIFKDTTSGTQLKLKIQMVIDLRIVGFEDGNKGSKNEDYFSSILLENDDKTIISKVGVTSLTEKLRDWFYKNKEILIGDVMAIECNDITKARSNDYYALSHPRYSEMRTNDKDSTDTLERALEIKQMAMELK